MHLSIQVSASGLDDRYKGEVYHMNITCNNSMNCVYFKLNETTDLTQGI